MKLCPKCQKQFSDDANFCPVDAARLAPIEAQTAGGDSLAARFDLGARAGGTRTGDTGARGGMSRRRVFAGGRGATTGWRVWATG